MPTLIYSLERAKALDLDGDGDAKRTYFWGEGSQKAWRERWDPENYQKSVCALFERPQAKVRKFRASVVYVKEVETKVKLRSYV